MARSAHAYVRGSTERFYAWLGRCEGAAVVELHDLDQTTIGNPAFDVLRLALSLAMAARGSDLPGVTTAHMTEELVAATSRRSRTLGRPKPSTSCCRRSAS